MCNDKKNRNICPLMLCAKNGDGTCIGRDCTFWNDGERIPCAVCNSAYWIGGIHDLLYDIKKDCDDQMKLLQRVAGNVEELAERRT